MGHVKGRSFVVGFVTMIGGTYVVRPVRIMRIWGWRRSMVGWAMVARLVLEGIEGFRVWWQWRWWVMCFHIKFIC